MLCGIDLDDQMSGYTIFNNTFDDCQVGMFVGGGRRNIVLNNSYRACDTAVHFDSRGHGCFDTKCYPNCPGNCDAATIWTAVGNVTTTTTHANGSANRRSATGTGTTVLLRLGPIKAEYLNPPWSTAFPAISHLLDDAPATAAAGDDDTDDHDDSDHGQQRRHVAGGGGGGGAGGGVASLGDPVMNSIVGNVACGCGVFLSPTCSDSGKTCEDDIVTKWQGTVHGNIVQTTCSGLAGHQGSSEQKEQEEEEGRRNAAAVGQ